MSMKEHGLKKGLANRSPSAPKEKLKGASVNKDAKRSSTAPTPKTLGPRNA